MKYHVIFELDKLVSFAIFATFTLQKIHFEKAENHCYVFVMLHHKIALCSMLVV